MRLFGLLKSRDERFKEFAQRACHSERSISTQIAHLVMLEQAVTFALADSLNVNVTEASNLTREGLSVCCGTCGQKYYGEQIDAMLLKVSGTDRQKARAIVVGDELRRNGCPKCKTCVVRVTFNPQSVLPTRDQTPPGRSPGVGNHERADESASSDQQLQYCFPLFLFDWRVISEKVSSIYGEYACGAIKERLSAQTPIVLDPNWRAFHGDLLIPDVMSRLVSPDVNADVSLVDKAIADGLRSGTHNSIYIVGIGNSETAIVHTVDMSLREDRVDGYLGVLMLPALDPESCETVRKALSLPFRRL